MKHETRKTKQHLRISLFFRTFAGDYGTKLYLDRAYSSRSCHGLRAIFRIWTE